MLRPVALFVSCVFAASSLAFAAPMTRSLVADDGVRVEYTSQLDDAEHIRLMGRVVDTQESFSLIVRLSGRVTGNFGGRKVDFTIGRARRDRLAAALKARQSLAVARLDVVTASQDR